MATAPKNATGTDTYILAGQAPGAYQCYEVRAFNAAGESPAGLGGACVKLPDGKPAAPSNLVATPLNSTQIKLTWNDNAPNMNNPFAEDGFYIYDKYGWPADVVGPNARSYTVSNLSPNAYYCFRVTAYNGWGEAGLVNAGACATTRPAPAVPSTKYKVVLSWNTPTEHQFDAHLWLPSATPAHVFWAARGDPAAFPWAELQQDAYGKMGSETVIITQVQAGTYTYAVDNYPYPAPPASNSLAGSGATVKVYGGTNAGTLLATFTAPASGSGEWWTVFTLSSNGTIQPINTLGDTVPAPY